MASKNLITFQRMLQKLPKDDREALVYQLWNCWQAGHYNPGEWNSPSKDRYYKTFKEILIYNLSHTLTGESQKVVDILDEKDPKRKKLIQITRGVDAFEFASIEEKREFSEAVRKGCIKHKVVSKSRKVIGHFLGFFLIPSTEKAINQPRERE